MSNETQSYVSAELTHFVGRAKNLSDGKPDNAERYKLLLKILGDRCDARTPRQGWLQASYREEFGPGFVMRSDGQKQLSTNDAITCTMLCFCDIPLRQLQIHMQKYGSFGIALRKQFLIGKGATPVYYIPRNASNRTIGIGPRNVADRFDDLRAQIHRVRNDLERYVTHLDGYTPSPSTSPPSTPEGHQLRARFSRLEADFEEMVFGRMKFFEAGLPEEHEENFYMEREWRLYEGLAFGLGDVARIFLPRNWCQQFHEDIPDYAGPVGCEPGI
jgi:hypothetical protein